MTTEVEGEELLADVCVALTQWFDGSRVPGIDVDLDGLAANGRTEE